MIRFIGDIHQNYDSYFRIIKGCDYSLQIGDMGYNYDPLKYIDAVKHRVLAGNHDNYNHLTKHFLGDYGVHSFGKFSFFYIRGAYSIDKMYRIENIDWFPQEELNYKQMNDCLDLFEKIRPSVVVSHECPAIINHEICRLYSRRMFPPSMTARFLEEAFERHQPQRWYFGHWHIPFSSTISECKFVCIPEENYVEFDIEGNEKEKEHV